MLTHWVEWVILREKKAANPGRRGSLVASQTVIICGGQESTNSDHSRGKPIAAVSGGIEGAIEAHDTGRSHERSEPLNGDLDSPCLLSDHPVDTTRKF